MAIKASASFDPKSFLGEGRGIVKYRKNQIVFSQSEPLEAVFYILDDQPQIRS